MNVVNEQLLGVTIDKVVDNGATWATQRKIFISIKSFSRKKIISYTYSKIINSLNGKLSHARLKKRFYILTQHITNFQNQNIYFPCLNN